MWLGEPVPSVAGVDRNPEWTTTSTTKDTQMLPDPRTNFHEINRRMASDHGAAAAGRLARSHRANAEAGPSILRVTFRRLGRWSHLQPSTSPARPLA